MLIVARLWAAASGRPLLRRKAAPPPERRAEDLLPCPRCGAWLAPGAPCDCRRVKG